MRKKQPRFILLLFAIATLLLLWFLLTPRTPSYQGRPLNSWLSQLDNHDGPGWSWQSWSAQAYTSESQKAAANAIRQMGTNTIPILLSKIDNKDPGKLIQLELFLRRHNWFSTSWLSNHIEQQKNLRHQAALALDVLGPDAKPALPRLVKLFYATDDPKQAAIAISGIGPAGWIELTKAIADTNDNRAISGIWALGMHGAAAPGTVDALIHSLANTNSGAIGPLAAWALGEIKQNPDQVIPALTAALQSPHQDIRWSSADSLAKFGNQSTNALPALLKALEDPDRNVRTYATNSIKKIDPTALR
jgi:HEAT repeats